MNGSDRSTEGDRCAWHHVFSARRPGQRWCYDIDDAM